MSSRYSKCYAAHNVTSHPKDRALPNQLTNGAKHIIKFTYEKSSRNEARSAWLRKLECNGLKFCGLAYTIRDLLKLPELQFEFLVELLNTLRNLSIADDSCRSDTNKALDKEIDSR